MKIFCWQQNGVKVLDTINVFCTFFWCFARMQGWGGVVALWLYGNQKEGSLDKTQMRAGWQIRWQEKSSNPFEGAST